MAERLLDPRTATIVALVLLLAGGILGTALDNPSSGLGARPPQAIGSSGAVFAQVLGGVRSAAAAYLWIKLDDDHHQFYGGDMGKERPLMPLFRIATWLDPRLERAYYAGSYMLWIYGRKRDAIDFALEGVRNNPTSVMLTLNVGQLYLMGRGDGARREALQYLAIAEKMSRGTDDEFRLNVMNALDAVYKKWRIPGEPKAILREVARMRALARKGALAIPPQILDRD